MKKVIVHFIDGKTATILYKSWELIMNKASTSGTGNLQSIFEDGNFICSFMLTNITYVEPMQEII